MEEEDRQLLDAQIRNAFADRPLPKEILKGPIAGNELPAGHPGYGKGEPILCNETDHIVRHVLGKTWHEVRAQDLEWSVLYVSIEAVAYYMPAMLIHNIWHGYELESFDVYLTWSRPQRGEPNSLKEQFYDVLTASERLAVAAYMESVPQDHYKPGEIMFWRGEFGEALRNYHV